MPLVKLVPMKVGDSKKIGEKEYELTEGDGLLMQVALPFSKTYSIGGLQAKRAQLVEELAEVDSLIAKHAELLK